MSCVAARYYDGRSARALPARLTIEADTALLTGDGFERRWLLAELRVSEPIAHSPRMITFPDGSHCEIDDQATFDGLLDSTGYREPWVVRLQSRWRHVLLALVGVIAVVAAGVHWGVPLAANVIAQQVPLSFETSLGEQAMKAFEAQALRPSALPAADRDRLTRRFALIVPADAPPHRVEIRGSQIGPNAFALPGGWIVITDELIQAAGSDEAVLAAFAHELGHLHHRHTMRRIIASTIVASGAAVLFGDWSSLLAFAPAMLVDLSYSRSMEIEADDYARELLARNGVPVRALVDLLRALERAAGGGVSPATAGETGDAERPPRLLRYLSTHPDTGDRIRRLLESGR
jgi:Zn-dependent protease with chaperone function